MSAAPSITNAQVLALASEAAEAGDSKQVALCECALAGSYAAREECALVIEAARAEREAFSADAFSSVGAEDGQQ